MSILIYAPVGIAVKSLCSVFEHSGIVYDSSTSMQRSLQLFGSGNYSSLLVIHTETLDCLLRFHEKWRALNKAGSFIVVSKRQSGLERVHALNAGVNSYHITPFSYTQLVRDVAQYEYDQPAVEHIVDVHGLVIDTISRSVTYKGKYVHMTKKQFDLLALFMRQPGRVYSRVQIWEKVWSGGEYPLANTVDVHVNRLRKALPTAARELIETAHGFGYRIKAR